MSRRTVKASCVVEVQVECDSTWSDDTTMAQIVKQAEQDAKHQITKLFEEAVTPDSQLSVKRSTGRGVYLGSVKQIVTRVIEEK